MRRLLTARNPVPCLALVLVAGLVSCQRVETTTPIPAASSSAAASALPSEPAASPEAGGVPGWTTTGSAFLLLGKQSPAFKGPLASGGEMTLDRLRDHWTIVGFEGGAMAAGEGPFVQALNSAAGQDPDLDFMTVGAAPSQGWAAVADPDGKIAAAFGVTDFPTYLLIGPDLTIEAMRGPLAATPDNGIKDVIRGVADIRKQIADPT